MTTTIQPFYAMTIGAAAIRMQDAGESVLHMEYGQPSAPPPDAVRKAARAMLDDHVKGYWESAALKEAIASSYASVYGADIDPSRVILTCGASPALALALMTLFKPGDRIAMARPGYVAHRNCVAGLHMEAAEVPCGPDTGFQLTAEKIAALPSPVQGLIIASPANPTGSIIPKAELAKIVAVCAGRGIRIVSDEIYDRITYTGRASSVSMLTEDAAIVNSFSKYYMMPGWRLGWALMPKDKAADAHAYMSNFFLTPPSLSQAAGLAAFSCTEALDAQIEIYRRNRARLLEALPTFGITDIAPPDGAFYIYGRVDQWTDDSRELCMKLLEETGVATSSGVDFDPVDGRKFIRLSFAVTEDEVSEAVERLSAWFPNQPRRPAGS